MRSWPIPLCPQELRSGRPGPDLMGGHPGTPFAVYITSKRRLAPMGRPGARERVVTIQGHAHGREDCRLIGFCFATLPLI